MIYYVLSFSLFIRIEHIERKSKQQISCINDLLYRLNDIINRLNEIVVVLICFLFFLFHFLFWKIIGKEMSLLGFRITFTVVLPERPNGIQIYITSTRDI